MTALDARFVCQMVKRGVATVDVLNAIVSPWLAGKPDLLAAWKSAKRLVEPGVGSGLGHTGREGRVVVVAVIPSVARDLHL